MHILSLIRSVFQNVYSAITGQLSLEGPAAGQQSLIFWQNRLFTAIMKYAVPLSLFALIPSTILELREGRTAIVIFNIVSLSLVAGTAFQQRISIYVRKLLVAALIVLFAVVIMAFMGSFTLGCIYLFPLSVFVALQFSNRAAYLTVALNFVICSSFALILWLKPMLLPALQSGVSLNHWLIYSVNFLFVDLVVVILIRQLLTGLSRTMTKEVFLHLQLQRELREKNTRNQLLKESEAHYRTLFFQSPLPKLIFDTESLQFLQVNDAALEGYGYSQEEFLTMKLPEIHQAEQVPELLEALAVPVEQAPSYISRHLRKDGREMHVEVRRSNILFGGKNARLIIATDITEQVNHTRKIELNNKKLQEIAYVQSHVVRVPLANIIGLSGLIMETGRAESEKELFGYLDQSVKQLDQAINEIVHYVEDLLPKGE